MTNLENSFEQRARELVGYVVSRMHGQWTIRGRDHDEAVQAIAAALREAYAAGGKAIADELLDDTHYESLRSQLAAALAEGERLREAIEYVLSERDGGHGSYWLMSELEERAALAPRAAGGEGTAG